MDSKVSFDQLFGEDNEQALSLFFLWANDLLGSMGVERTMIKYDAAYSYVKLLRKDGFPSANGYDSASPFKKAAHLYVYLHSENPFSGALTRENVGVELAQFPHNTASIVGFSIVKACLQNTEITKSDGSTGKLEKEIAVSRHFFHDFVEASAGITPMSHFKVFSIIFEALAYEANPGLCYKKEF